MMKYLKYVLAGLLLPMSVMAAEQVPLLQNAQAYESMLLNGDWHYVVDVQEEATSFNGKHCGFVLSLFVFIVSFTFGWQAVFFLYQFLYGTVIVAFILQHLHLTIFLKFSNSLLLSFFV